MTVATMTKLAYYSPEEVQSALEEMDETGVSDESEMSGEESDVELEIDFDPPRAPIRITSPDQIPLMVGGGGRNYAIHSQVLSEFLRRKNDELIQSGKKLTTLALNKVCFPDQENGQWASATRNLLNLKNLIVTTCNNMDTNIWLENLAQLPCLESLELCNVTAPYSVSPSFPAITSFLQQRKETLVQLRIDGLKHERLDVEVEDFCRVAQGCKALKVLHWNSSCITQEQVVSFCNLLQANTTGLEELEMNVDQDVSLVPMAQSLAGNGPLRKLRVWVVNNSPSPNFGTRVAEVHAFQETLTTKNVHLEDLQMSSNALRKGWGRWLGSFVGKQNEGKSVKDEAQRALEVFFEIQFFLELNRSGRKHFMKGGNSNHSTGSQESATTKPKEDWVDAVVANREELSVIFYYLQLNPSIYFG